MKKILLLFPVLFCVIFYAYGDEMVEATLPEEVRTVAPAEKRSPHLVYVYISGAVKNPGVYSYKQRLTVGEVVKDAGGFVSYADADGLNLAAMTEDGMHIHVPYKLDGMPVEKEDDGKIHINEADEKKLTELPGIGPAMAAQIVAYRDEHGAFTSVEELKQVKGIGTAKWEKLKDKVDL